VEEPSLSDVENAVECHSGTRTAREILNLARAYHFLCVESRGETLSVPLIMKTHQILQGASPNEHCCRSGEAYIGAHLFPAHQVISSALAKIVESFNMRVTPSRSDRIQLASWLMYELLALHPFFDGNGRLSRLFLNWVLLAGGQPFPTVFEDDGFSIKGRHRHLMAAVLQARLAAGQPAVLASLVVTSVHDSWAKLCNRLT